MSSLIVAAIVVVAVAVFIVIVFKAMWRVAEPNEALVISGLKHVPDSAGSGEAFGFKIVVGKGVLVIPGVQAVVVAVPADGFAQPVAAG